MCQALAARLATSLVSSLNIKRFILEEDYEIVILALQQYNIAQDWQVSSAIHNIIDFIPVDF